MIQESVKIEDRHVINSTHLVDAKYENIWKLYDQFIILINTPFYCDC